MELMQAVVMRKSVRAYQAVQIDTEALEKILLAGAAGPVGMGAYDKLHYTVVQDKVLLDRISKAAAALRGATGDPTYAAPTLVVISSAVQPDPNLAYVNAACIGENMMLAATELGVGSVILWATALAIAADAELAAAIGIPADYKPVLGIVFGISAEAEAAPKALEARISTNYV